MAPPRLFQQPGHYTQSLSAFPSCGEYRTSTVTRAPALPSTWGPFCIPSQFLQDVSLSPLLSWLDWQKPTHSGVLAIGATGKETKRVSLCNSLGNTVESEHLSELTEEEYEAHYIRRQDLKGFMWLDAKYLNPFFTRRLTQEDLHHGRIQMKTLTNKWYEEVRQGPSGSEDDEQELL
ncbi:hypothetical protein P7K49_009885 [Saguinus oedipus]|uniref:Uncharacterized protein n=1 Tax=Saguinus oedipus TaxID=9490 RepID=A0ABQ9VMM8_SAGOE|nr:hypothetical protein P7K49_009885 [Saguinus oedipus]